MKKIHVIFYFLLLSKHVLLLAPLLDSSLTLSFLWSKILFQIIFKARRSLVRRQGAIFLGFLKLHKNMIIISHAGEKIARY
jgi:hypothetical protein